jgi:UrcA family protein
MNAEITLRPAPSYVLIAAAWVVFSAMAPLVASAEPPATPATPTLEARVALSDLDLTTPEGVALAHKRLERKAEYLCRQFWDDDSTLRRNYETCVNETLAIALQQLNTMSVLAAADRARTR